MRVFDVTLDSKWRLNFPVALVDLIRLDAREFLYLTVRKKDGCLMICILRPIARNSFADPIQIRMQEVKKKNGSRYRITIPQELQKCKSFHYGKTVTLVERSAECIEIWPRPKGVDMYAFLNF